MDVFLSISADIFNEIQGKVGAGIKLDCKGGGKIEKNNEAKTIKLFGKSDVSCGIEFTQCFSPLQGYGQADHSLAQGIVKAAYPNFDVQVTND